MLPSRRTDRRPQSRALFDRAIIMRAIVESFVKLDPGYQARNTVMFIVEVGALLSAIFAVRDFPHANGQGRFDVAISLWLWFTVLFANFAEAVAEGRGRAQAEFQIGRTSCRERGAMS